MFTWTNWRSVQDFARGYRRPRYALRRRAFQRLAAAKGCAPSDITVCMLERPRHEEMIAEVRSTGASIRLITDGDVAGVMHCAESDLTGIDMYMGTGGAPEGVLAASRIEMHGWSNVWPAFVSQ